MTSETSGKNTILAATDLSPASDAVVLEADAVARDRGARLVVAHVLPEVFGIHPLFPQLNLPEAFSLAEAEHKVGELLERRTCELTGRTPDEFDVRLITGSAHDGIVAIAGSEEASLIVVGADGPGSTISFGHVTRHVVRDSKTDVLVVRPAASALDGPVVVATDFSKCSMAAQAAAKKVAKRYPGGLALIYSFDFVPQRYPMPLADVPLPSSRDIERVRDELGRLLEDEADKLGAKPYLKEGAAADNIAEAARELKSPLVIVGTHGRTGIGRFALGSVAEGVVAKSPCSVLVARS